MTNFSSGGVCSGVCRSVMRMLTGWRSSPTSTVNTGMRSLRARARNSSTADSEPRFDRPSLTTITPRTGLFASRFISVSTDSPTLVPSICWRTASIRLSSLVRLSANFA